MISEVANLDTLRARQVTETSEALDEVCGALRNRRLV